MFTSVLLYSIQMIEMPFFEVQFLVDIVAGAAEVAEVVEVVEVDKSAENFLADTVEVFERLAEAEKLEMTLFDNCLDIEDLVDNSVPAFVENCLADIAEAFECCLVDIADNFYSYLIDSF